MTLKWELVRGEIVAPDGGRADMLRTPVPGGWLVACYDGVEDRASVVSTLFIPDPDHVWGREVEPKPTRCALMAYGAQCMLGRGHPGDCSFPVDLEAEAKRVAR